MLLYSNNLSCKIAMRKPVPGLSIYYVPTWTSSLQHRVRLDLENSGLVLTAVCFLLFSYVAGAAGGLGLRIGGLVEDPTLKVP